MKKTTILLFLTAVSLTINAQNNAVSGILDFLSSNPGTSNHMTQSQRVGAQVISRFLNNQTQKEHEINVARAGQAQVNITNPNQQVISAPAEPEARLQREADGRVYLYYGNNEPRLIPEEYLLRAMGINYETDYTADEMAALKRKISFQDFEFPYRTEEKHLKAWNGAKRKRDQVQYEYDFTSPDWGENLIGVKNESTGDIYYLTGDSEYPGKGIKFVWDQDLTFYYHITPKALYHAFSCNWYEDFNVSNFLANKENHFLPIESYHGIKRKFKHGEKMVIITLCMLAKETPLKLSYYKEESGEKVFEENANIGDTYIVHSDITTSWFPPGKYLFVIQIEDKEGVTGETMLKHSFEILPGDPVIQEEKSIFRSSAPRGIVFYSAFEEPDFLGMNQPGYDISNGKLKITMNVDVKDNNQNVIYQSYTLSGELLGTTTKLINGVTWTGPDSNPTENLDFLDHIKARGPGKYKIKAIVEATGEEFIRILTIK